MNLRKIATRILFVLLLGLSVSNVSVAQTAEELEFYSEIAILLEYGEYEEALLYLDGYKTMLGGDKEPPLSIFYRAYIYVQFSDKDGALRVIRDYKRATPNGQGEVHDGILEFERLILEYQALETSLQAVMNSAAARQLAQRYSGTTYSASMNQLVDLFARGERLTRELGTLHQKKYAADFASENAEGPIYGGMGIGLGGWLFLELLAEEEDLRKASNYFLLAGGAIVAYGFFKLIRNQNKSVEYTNRISAIESEIGLLNSEIYTKKQEILQLVGY